MASSSLSAPSTFTTLQEIMRSLIKSAERGGIILKSMASYQRYGFRVSASKYSTPKKSFMIDAPGPHGKGYFTLLYSDVREVDHHGSQIRNSVIQKSCRLQKLVAYSVEVCFSGSS